MTLDPLMQKMTELEAAKIAVQNAVKTLATHLRDHECVRDDLITAVRSAHAQQKRVMGIE